jgi:hypothetical protein
LALRKEDKPQRKEDKPQRKEDKPQRKEDKPQSTRSRTKLKKEGKGKVSQNFVFLCGTLWLDFFGTRFLESLGA